jgi:Chaperone of endosialidase
MSSLFSRNQVLKTAGVFLAGAAAESVSHMISSEPVQAQSGVGTFSTVNVVSSGNIQNPQIRILQTNSNDFARLRFSVKNQDFWDIATVFDRMNFFDQTNGDVMTLRSSGNLSIKGTLTQGSSRTLKENITELSSKEALETLVNLNPVKFSYKADQEKANHIGFIAEDVPDLVAVPDRKGLNAMDIVGVLTKAVQEQQKTILALTEKVAALEAKNRVG